MRVEYSLWYGLLLTGKAIYSPIFSVTIYASII